MDNLGQSVDPCERALPLGAWYSSIFLPHIFLSARL